MKALDKKNVQDILGLTPFQEGLLLGYLQNTSEDYIEQCYLEFVGTADVEEINRIWQEITNETELLRAVFRWEGLNRPIMVLLKQHNVHVHCINFSDHLDGAVEIQKSREGIRYQGLDLTEVPFKVTVYDLGPEKHGMLLTHHHLLYDGWSNALLIKAFIDRRNGQTIVSPKHIFKSYLKSFQQPSEKTESYWSSYLKDVPAVTEIPYLPLNAHTGSKDFQEIVIDEQLLSDLSELARSTRQTTANILLTTWGILLARHNKRDIVFGTTVSHRPVEIPEVTKAVGPYIHTIPVKVPYAHDQKMEEVLSMAMKDAVDPQRLAYTSLADIAEYAGKVGSGLFNTLIVVENYPLDSKLFKAGRLRSYELDYSTHYPLSVVVTQIRDELVVRFTYDESAGEESIRQLATLFKATLQQVVDHPQSTYQDLPGIQESDQAVIEAEVAEAAGFFPSDKTVMVLFEEHVANSPHQTAIISGDRSVSYLEFNQLVNGLATHINPKVKRGDVIAILADRSLEMMVGIYAVMKLACAYLPISNDFPRSRVAYMLKDSDASLLLTEQKLEHVIDLAIEPVVIELDQLEKGKEFVSRCEPDDLAYVIYTSGSTGSPKGVIIDHMSLMNRLYWMWNAYDLTKEDVILQKTPYIFDVSVWEIFLWSQVGAKLVLAPPKGEKDPDILQNLMAMQQVTTVHFVPSMLSNFLYYARQTGLDRLPDTLRLIFCSGEVLKPEMVTGLAKLIGADTQIINLYGPTEATIDITYFNVPDGYSGTSIPIGRPIQNHKIYLLDEQHRPVAPGEQGELAVSGVGVARGYMNKKELTAQRFISNPNDPDKSLYLTGDLAKWSASGHLEYLGRLDHQLKIDGLRIEPGEIEAHLIQFTGIRQVLAVARIHLGRYHLVAYYESDEQVSSSELRMYLSKKLYPSMIPSFFIHVNAFPLLSNGKIDRGALQDLKIPRPGIQKGNLDMGNQSERKVAKICAEILGLDHVGIHENLFELGAKSFDLTAMVARINREFDKQISVIKLFETTTVAAIAAYLQEMKPVKKSEVKAGIRLEGRRKLASKRVR